MYNAGVHITDCDTGISVRNTDNTASWPARIRGYGVVITDCDDYLISVKGNSSDDDAYGTVDIKRAIFNYYYYPYMMNGGDNTLYVDEYARVTLRDCDWGDDQSTGPIDTENEILSTFEIGTNIDYRAYIDILGYTASPDAKQPDLTKLRIYPYEDTDYGNRGLIQYMGNITAGTEVWSSDYIREIDGSMIIGSDATLEIEEGTDIYFTEGIENKLQVLGTLDAQGTSVSNITFTTINERADIDDPLTGDWGGILFDENASNCFMNYCNINYADIGINCDNMKLVTEDPVVSRLKVYNSDVTYCNTGVLFRNACEVFLGFSLTDIDPRSGYTAYQNTIYPNIVDIDVLPDDDWADDYVNLTYNYYSVGLVPVTLSGFTTTYDVDSIEVYWQTSSETDNLGWYIWRSEIDSTSGYEKLNSTLIPGQGTTAQTTNYYYGDFDFEEGKTYYYKLQQIDTGGESHWSYVSDPLRLAYTGDTIVNNTTWRDTVEVLGDVNIASGCTLTIEAGTQIIVAAGVDSTHAGTNSGLCEIIINGALICNGTDEVDSIVFTSSAGSPAANDWYGFRNSGMIDLDYCAVKYASYPFRNITGAAKSSIKNSLIKSFGYYGVEATTGNLILENTLIDGCSYSNGRGISIGTSNLDSAAIFNNTIQNLTGSNYLYGILVSSGNADMISVVGNTITDFDNGSRMWGMYVVVSDSLLIKSNVIANMSGAAARGMYIYGSDYNIIENNKVINTEGNFQYGIYLSMSDYADIGNDTISNVSSSAMYCYNSASVNIEDCLIRDNNSSYALYLTGSSTADADVYNNTIQAEATSKSCDIGVLSESYAVVNVKGNMIEDFGYFGIYTGSSNDSVYCGASSDSGNNNIYWDFDDKGSTTGYYLIYNEGSDTTYAYYNYFGPSPSSGDFYGPIKWSSYLADPSVGVLVACFNMDEGSGSTLNDNSVFENDGTIYGASWDDGIADSALNFDGSNDYVNVPNDTSLQLSGDMTISFWLYPHDLGNARENPIDKSYGGEFALTLEDDPDSGNLSYFHGTQRSGGYYYGWTALNTGTIQDSSWQHIVITRSASDWVLKSYYNGDSVKTTVYDSSANKLPSASTYAVKIGNGYTNAYFDGLIDEVKIYNKVLTSQDISFYYNNLSGGAGKAARDIVPVASVDLNVDKMVQIRPNPFKSSTNIYIYLPVENRLFADVNITIYNSIGNEVRSMVFGKKISGREYMVHWDGKNNAGADVDGGFYYYSVSVGSRVETGKMMLVK